MYLHNIKCSRAADLREGYSDRWVNNGLPLLELVLDVLEWSSTVDHLIEDAAKRPDVTRTTNLKQRERENRLPVNTILPCQQITKNTCYSFGNLNY